MQEDNDFQRRIRQRFRRKPIQPQNNLEDLEKQIKAFDDQQLQDHTSTTLDAADKAHAHWVEMGDGGWSGAKRSVQEFSTKFAAFVQVYGGFIDVIRQANGPYGEVAYTTLSLLFTVSFLRLSLLLQAFANISGCCEQI